MPTNTRSASGSWVRSDIKLTGKTVIITGANTGIGLETAIDLVKREARVIIACRSLERGGDAKNRILEETNCDEEKVVVKQLDLSSFESVRKFAADVNASEERLDILINNAGIMGSSVKKTSDGFEINVGVNHLGHFLLTNLLLDLIKRSAPARIVVVSSEAHKQAKRIQWDKLNTENSSSSFGKYAESKLMNILFVKELVVRLEGTNVSAYALHPGAVQTDLWNHMFDGDVSCWRSCLRCCTYPIRRVAFKTAVHGAQTSIYCAIATELANVSGKYFSDCKIASESSAAKKLEDAKRLWEVSEELTGLTLTQQTT